MNIENLFKLKKGSVIKNYTVMCNILDEKPCGGNSKKYQLQEWQRFFNYHNEGHKFIIDEVFKEPKEKIDLRGCNGLFIEDIQLLILDMLVKTNKNTVCYSCSKLLEALRIVNENYSIGRRNMKNFSNFLSININVVHDFYQYEHKKLKTNLECALNSLKRKGLIHWTEIIMVYVYDHVQICDGLYEEKLIWREASNEEIKIILDTYNQVLSQMELSSLNQIYTSYYRYTKFNQLVKNIFKSENIKIYNSYYAYKIIQSTEYVAKKLNEENKKLIEKELNFKTLQSAYKSIEEKGRNVKNKYNEEWGELQELNALHRTRLQEDYQCSCKRISDIIIDLEHEKINLKDSI